MLPKTDTTWLVLPIIALSACAAPPAQKEEVAPEPGLAAEPLGSADHAGGPDEAAWCTPNAGELTRRRPHQSWRFDGRCDDVFIDLASREGDDMFLIVYSRAAGETEWQLEDWNDDCYRGTLNACLETSTEAGREYLLVATTFEYVAWRRRTPATYELQISCRTADGVCFVPSDEEPQACGSRGLAPCPEGQYCDWDDAAMCGAADAPGVCRPRPEACSALYDPVCGCDGRTYGNACSAAAHGVDVASAGECPTAGQGEGETCGGIAALECAEGLECDYSANEGCYADAGGVCVRRDSPIACTREYAPVCGCDGVTYSNDCMRRAAGMALDHVGACETAGDVGDTCGGIAGLTCAAGLICDYTDSICAADATGTCQYETSVLCTTEYRPVCGCDGVTYSNDCRRQQANVALAYEGVCS